MMWYTEVKRICKASEDRIWQLWTDVGGWNRWDGGVKNAILDGVFEVGMKGKLKPTHGPKTKFTLIECTEKVSFTNRTRLPFCKIDFIHCLTRHEECILVTHRIEIKGFLSPFFSGVVGR